MTLDITATDMFCGAGGSTTGATMAGVEVKLAINHWKRAIETHNANYPDTTHALTDLHVANPRRFPSTTLLIASPECTSHSISKGRKRKSSPQAQMVLPGIVEDEPTLSEERSRCTMYTPLEWSEEHLYQAAILENVVDIQLWKPFPAWLLLWENLGYRVQVVCFNSMFALPTPQSRDRVYIVATKKGNRAPDLCITPLAHCPRCRKDVYAIQSWRPHVVLKWGHRFGKYRQQYDYCCPQCSAIITPYYYAAANAIDWSKPCPRIGDRKDPLKPKTRERIQYGLEKFSGSGFITQGNSTSSRARELFGETLPTLTCDDGNALVWPFLFNMSHNADGASHNSYLYSSGNSPFPTQTTRQDIALVNPFLMDHLGEYRPRPIEGPMSTICAGGNHHSLIVPQVKEWILTYYGNAGYTTPVEPLPTCCTVDTHALVCSRAAGHLPSVEDCGFRMLAPHEIQKAMAFPDDYILTGTAREKIKQLGNAVTPPVMKLLMERVIASLQ